MKKGAPFCLNISFTLALIGDKPAAIFCWQEAEENGEKHSLKQTSRI
jgi:hypothetical protein